MNSLFRKSTRTPVIVSSLEAKRWPVVVTDFSDLMRDKHITNLEDKNHDGTKRIDPTTATPTTVLRHAVDITKVKYLNYGHILNSRKSLISTARVTSNKEKSSEFIKGLKQDHPAVQST